MEHKKHKQLNLIYFVGIDQPQVGYYLIIPEITPDPQDLNSSSIYNSTYSLYDTHTNEVGIIIGNTIYTSISASQNIQMNTYIISLSNGTMTFGFTVIGNNNDNFYIGGQVINLNFMYGSGEYQNANVKYATLLPVNDPNQTRILTIEFDD